MSQVILLSAIGGDLAQSVARCLRDDIKGCRLIGLDVSNQNSGSLFVEEFFIAQKPSSKTFISSLTEIIKVTKPDFYFPLNELELAKLASISVGELNIVLGSTKIVWAGAQVLNTFLSKKSTMAFLKNIGVTTPQSFELSSIESFRYPLIVKPNKSSGSKEIFICKNKQELDAALVFVGDPEIQEYIPDVEAEYTVGVFARNGDQIRSVCFRRKLSGGHTSWCEYVYDAQVEDICTKIAKKIKLNGSLNVQFRKRDGKIYVFEINPRFSSTVHIRSQIGFKDVIWSIDENVDIEKFKPDQISYSKFGVFQTAARLK
jgi:carbamoyl-phosphate synthase large subunit